MGGMQRRTFGDLVAQDDDELDLARAALAVALDEFPGLDVDAYVGQLDAVARDAAACVPEGATGRGRVLALNRFLFNTCGFRGNLEAYYDPQNSYLNRVLDRRLGIPITLSLVYLEVGRRLGLPLVGVGLPGHFLVKYAGADEELLIDPFYEGALLGRTECQQRLDAIYGGKVVLTEPFLHGVGKRDVLARLLYNLKRVHTRDGDVHRALRVLDHLVALQPYAFEDLRDRGTLRYKAGRYDEALADLRAYLEMLPSAPDAGSVRRTISACERLSTRA